MSNIVAETKEYCQIDSPCCNSFNDGISEEDLSLLLATDETFSELSSSMFADWRSMESAPRHDGQDKLEPKPLDVAIYSIMHARQNAEVQQDETTLSVGGS